jgi:hypothetical protein
MKPLPLPALRRAAGAALVLGVAATAHAQDPAKAPAAPQVRVNFVDHSATSLIDKDTAMAVMKENIPARVWRLYPANRYAFVSQVEGGVTGAGTCVVTARVMMLPLTPTMKAVLFRPQKTATAFDSVAGAGREQCQAVAREKLKEATAAVVSALVKT